MTRRRWLYVQLHPQGWPGQGLSPANKIVAAAIVLAVVLAILQTEEKILSAYAGAFGAADIVLGILFTGEYVLRLWIAGEEAKYQGVVGRLKFVVSPLALIDLVAVLPFLLTAGLGDTVLLRLFRMLRLLALAKLGRYSTALQNIYDALRMRRYELVMSLGVAFVVMLLAAAVLHYTERSTSPESFGSIPRALWWGVATITKVGYAGAFPETVLGKIFAGIFAIAAVGVVALPTGILAASFGDAFRKERRGDRRSD